MHLERTADGWQCREELRHAAGGLSYAQMVEAAEAADFRRALWQIAESIADLFGTVAFLVSQLREMPSGPAPTWEELTSRWRVS